MKPHFLYIVVSFLQEMIELIKDSVVLILHTHDGARVGMHCLWYGTVKVSQDSVGYLY